MKRFKHFLMMAMAITLCVGFSSCKDDDDDDDKTSGGAISANGADWSFSRCYFYAEEDDYYDELDCGFIMQGTNEGQTFCLSWYPYIDALRNGTSITADEFEVYLGSMESDDGDWIFDYEPVSGTVTATDVTSRSCTVKFDNLKLRMEDSADTSYGFPQTVTLNGSATFQFYN